MANRSFGCAFRRLSVRRVPSMLSVPTVGARVLILQPNEQAYRALHEARARELTPAFRTIYAKRAGVEGTIAQAVRTCEMRRARYIGSKKLRLQAFLTATAMNVLRACAWITGDIHASTPTSRFAMLIASPKAPAAPYLTALRQHHPIRP